MVFNPTIGSRQNLTGTWFNHTFDRPDGRGDDSPTIPMDPATQYQYPLFDPALADLPSLTQAYFDACHQWYMLWHTPQCALMDGGHGHLTSYLLYRKVSQAATAVYGELLEARIWDAAGRPTDFDPRLIERTWPPYGRGVHFWYGPTGPERGVTLP